MYLELPQFLTEGERQAALRLAAEGSFADGRGSASGAAAAVKLNDQLATTPEQSRKLDEIMSAAVGRRPELHAFSQAKLMRGPMLSRYRPGMRYGRHLDSPVMSQGQAMRTDVSMTVFLSEPESYDGGALILDTAYGEIECKPAAGDAVAYYTEVIHEVEEVTRGERLAIVTWFQSRVRDPQQRYVLFDLNVAHASLAQSAPNDPGLERLGKVLGNLTRQWSDV